MKTFGLDRKYDQINFAEVSAEELEIISGGSGAAGTIAMGLAGGWAAAVVGAGVGMTIGGPVGGIVGGAAGFVLGGLVTVGYALAS